MELYSHPDKLLIDHLNSVAENCRNLINNKKIALDGISDEMLREMFYFTGAFHDFGKGIKFFQKYLLDPDHNITGPKNHAFISAVFTKELFQKRKKDIPDNSFLFMLIVSFIFISIKKHHGILENYEDEILNIEEKKIEEIFEQSLNLEEEELQSILNSFYSKNDVEFNISDFKKVVSGKEFCNDMRSFHFENFILGDYETLDISKKISYYYLFQFLYSTLIYSDRGDVILNNYKPAGIKTGYNYIDVYRNKKNFNNPVNHIDIIKNNSFFESLNNLDKIFNKDKHLYSITLPTGMGKTITSFALALKLQEKINPIDSKIIITIPFTSIIDQNFLVYNEILDYPESSALLKHHHLADMEYKTGQDILDYNKSEFLIETWQSNVVVTTFVQLLETLYSNDKSRLLKFPNIINSIIIMDEIQTVDYKYWELINKTFKMIGKIFNCYFILMTATQPLIFNPGEEIDEIVPEFEKYFKIFNRTQIINRAKEEVDLQSFIEMIIKYIYENPDKDILVILNTKKYCLECFKRIRDIINDDREIFYLSTLITPFERKRIIKRIKDDKNRNRKIIISTQLIEAGVDISVDTVFRQIAPLDAIIQSAGRANRYSEKKGISDVYLYKIYEPARSTNRIYGTILMQKTENILENTDIIQEKDYLKLIRDYFTEIRKQSDNLKSDELESICNLRFKDAGNFKLIDESRSEQVFIQLNEESWKLWEEYTEIFNISGKNYFEKGKAFAKIKSKFYDYVINVPIPFGKKEIDFGSKKENGFYVSKLENPSQFYSFSESDYKENTGYGHTEIIMF
jgi:CRISPR-associated endonuclease/helicase Cas3